jgi:hypothetical protein
MAVTHVVLLGILLLVVGAVFYLLKILKKIAMFAFYVGLLICLGAALLFAASLAGGM